MVEPADLELNVLDFNRKSFSYERTVDWEGEPIALFARRETESESRFRPKVIRLRVALPVRWILYDLAADLLVPAMDGRPGAAPPKGEAVEAAAQPTRFEERGIAWRRQPEAEGGFLYVPEAWAARLLSPEGLARLRNP